MARTAPSNSDDRIDSREIIERIEELEGYRDALSEAREALTEAQAAESAATKALHYNEDAEQEEALEAAAEEARVAVIDAESAVDLALIDFDDDAEEELRTLTALQEEAEGYCEDWRYGASLIRHSHFKDYAQELADDIGAIPKDAGWPCTCIDWDEAARELQHDYTSVSFGDVEYFVR